MAEIQALRALHYDPHQTRLQDVVAPPYDVIDPEQRAELAALSPYNVVEIDLPAANGDPYEHAAQQLQAWREQSVVVQDQNPALWLLEQAYTGPDAAPRTRRGFLAKVRIEPYGPGRIRPHERTHPGPKEDRLRLTRATKANLSPIFALYDDARGQAQNALLPFAQDAPYGETTDEDGTANRIWRIDHPEAIDATKRALKETELLIADGHHRYETARVYADEIGGEGPHRYVLMCLVALQDPGLTVFPTHRLVKGLTPEQHEELANAIRRDFDVEPLGTPADLVPAADTALRIGYIDAHFHRPFMLTLKDQTIADQALSDHAEPYRRLDTAVLEALILKGTLGMSDADIDHLDGLGYARDARHALDLISANEYDAAFFMAPTPVHRVQEVAASGENMPPKSTYFFPKVPTGLVFNSLSD